MVKFICFRPSRQAWENLFRDQDATWRGWDRIAPCPASDYRNSCAFGQHRVVLDLLLEHDERLGLDGFDDNTKYFFMRI